MDGNDVLIKFVDIPDVGDCTAVTAQGEIIKIDPFVGCAWDWENKDALLGTVCVLSKYFMSKDNRCWLVNENGLRFAGVEDFFEAQQREAKQ